MKSKRHMVCTLAGLVALLCLFFTVPKVINSPEGIVLPAKVTRAPANPDNVTMYHHLPAGAEKLGQVRVEYAYPELNTDARDTLLAKVRTLAASVGANGVVIDVFVAGEGVRKILTFYGTPIYISGHVAGSKK